jgi:hypothetical protein
MRALALYREEELVDNDGYQEATGVFQPL